MRSKRTSHHTRPTMGVVLNAVTSMLGRERISGASVLDLYAGLGSYGLRALAMGAAHADFVEQNRHLCHRLATRLERTHPTAAQVWCGKVATILPTLDHQYDIVYADPPYADDTLYEVSQILLRRRLLRKGAILAYEHSSQTDSPAHLHGQYHRERYKKYGDSAVSLYTFKPESTESTEREVESR